MTEGATIGGLNVVIRMMTDGFNKAVSQVEDSLKRINDSADEVSESMEEMADSLDTSGINDALDEMTESVEEFEDEVEDATDDLREMGEVGDSIGNGIGTALGRLSPRFGKLRQSIGQVTKAFGEMGTKSKVATVAMAGAIATIAVGFVYQIGKKMYDKMGELVALANPTQYAKSTERLNASLDKLKTSLGTVLAPLFNGLTIMIEKAIDAFTWWSENVLAPVYGFLTGLFGAIGDIEGMTGVTSEVADSTTTLAENMEGVADAVEDTGRGLAGFDMLNTQSSTQGMIDSMDGMVDAQEAIQDTATLNMEQFEKVKKTMLEAAKTGKELSDTIGGIFGGVKGFFDSITSGINGILNDTGIADWWNGLGDTIKGVIDNISSWWNGLTGTVGTVFAKIVELSEGVQSFWNGMGSSLEGFGDSVVKGIKELFGKIKGFADDIVKLFSGISLTGVGDSLLKGFEGAIQGIKDVWNSTIGGVGISIDNPLGGKLVDFTIPKLAQGGVVDPNNPMLAMIGDNKKEKEAVAPLSSLQTMIDSAVQKSMSNAGAYGNKGSMQDITLAIDGRELARVTYDYMRSESRRRGATIARGV